MRSRYLIERAHLLWALRSFFHERGYLELEPPCVVSSPGLEPQLDAMRVSAPHAERYLELMRDDHHRSSARATPPMQWLHTSPEYAIKRYLGGEGRSVDRVYALTPCFRDEPPSGVHSPEFSMLELYARDLSLEGLMEQCEELVCDLARSLCAHRAQRAKQRSKQGHLRPQSQVQGQGHILPSRILLRPFERLSVREAFWVHAGIDLDACQNAERLRAAARSAGIRESGLHGGWDELYFQVFMDLIEPKLGQSRPTFLYDFPASQAALARLSPEDPRWARRFELFASGLELANAFDELSDPVEQRVRFERDLLEREARGAQRLPIDEALLKALPQLGSCVGIALGFDRLVMLLCGARSIDEVRMQDWR